MRSSSPKERLLRNFELRYFISLPADRKYLQLVRQFVSDICIRSGLTEAFTEDMIYITGEAVSNVVKHAYEVPAVDPEKKVVELELRIDTSKVELRISDYGKGFDKSVFHRLDEDEIREKVRQRHKGGLGLYMIDKLADELTITIEPFKKNQLIIVKKI